MHNRFEKASQEVELPIELPDQRSAALIDDYLERVTAPLVGWKDYDERQALRAEIRAHLEAGIAAFQDLGESRDEAVRSALKQLGNPDKIGRQYLDVSSGFSSILRLTRAAGGYISTTIGLLVGLLAIRIAALIMGLTPTADHSEYAVGALLGVGVSWRCWSRRLRIPAGACLGAVAGTASILTLILFNVLQSPHGLKYLLLADWVEVARVLLNIGIVGAFSGAIIGGFCQFIRRQERVPLPWVAD